MLRLHREIVTMEFVTSVVIADATIAACLTICPFTIRCELRDNASGGAGWDLQLFDNDGLLSSARYPLESVARSIAASLRSAHERDGWSQAN